MLVSKASLHFELFSSFAHHALLEIRDHAKAMIEAEAAAEAELDVRHAEDGDTNHLDNVGSHSPSPTQDSDGENPDDDADAALFSTFGGCFDI